MIEIRTGRESWRMVEAASIRPYERNAKIHGPEQIGRLRESLRQFGFVRPLLVDGELRLIAGHGMLAAAQAEGMDRVPVVVVEGLTEAQRRAYVHSDNRLAELAPWDEAMLALEIPELEDLGLDMAALGLCLDEAPPTVEEAPPPGEGDAAGPEIPGISQVSRRGDLWTLGAHRIYCGDATSRADVTALLNGATPDLLLTDPPYCSGGFQESDRGKGSIGTDRPDRGETMLINDVLSTRGYIAMIKAALENAPCRWAYIFTDWRMWVNLYDATESSGFGARSMIVWDKGSPGMGNGWRSQHELIYFGCRAPFRFETKRSRGNVQSIARTGNPLHPTQKPLELLEGLLDVCRGVHGVLDLFGGAMSTMMACQRAGLPSWSMELSPGFVDTGVRRFAAEYGWDQVTLLREGRTISPEESGMKN